MQRLNTWDHLPSETTLWHVFSTRQISAAEAEKDCIKGKKGTQTVQNRPEFVQTAVQVQEEKKDSPHCSEPETSHLRACPGFPAGRLLCPEGEWGSI